MRHTNALVKLAMVGLLMTAGCEEDGDSDEPQTGQTEVADTESSIRVRELGLSFSNGVHGDPVDIDEDGVNDFILNFGRMVFPDGASVLHFRMYAVVTALNGSAALVATPVSGGTIVGAETDSWVGRSEIATLYVGSSTTVSGPWYGVENQYMPIRFVSDGETHYGWIRMSVDTNMLWTVYDCAYMTEADEPIEMGDH
jgi:hypothetical protein